MYERAAVRWHVRFVYESKNVGVRESQAVLALLGSAASLRLTLHTFSLGASSAS
jgi:hypothetical protein